MRLEHPNYITLVIAAYKKKLANNELSPLLVQSTPANIRRECANVYQERYDKKDEPMLRAFFGPAEHGRKFLAVIQEFDINRFRPLDSYLKESGKRTITDRNVELLAWLIDFRHRPYSYGTEVTLNEEERLTIIEPINNTGINNPVINNTEPEPIDLKQAEEKLDINVEDADNTESKKTVAEPEENEPQKPGGKPDDIPGNDPNDKPVEDPSPVPPSLVLKGNKWSTVRKRSVMIALMLILFAGSVYTIWQIMEQQSGCMYWNGNQYVPVPCNEEPNGRVFLPLDVKKMKNFERITQKDTISARSIGKIYYIKHNNKIEYYTYSGNYPEDLTRYVKKLSRYIFEKDSMNRKYK